MRVLLVTSFLAVLAVVVISPSVVIAATSTASKAAEPIPAPVESSPPVANTQDHQAQIQQLQVNYGKVLAEYRDNERLFTIAQQQYYQLGTLASLEQAVQATRTVMLSRIDVLSNYLSSLELNLMDSKGIELGLKNKMVASLSDLLSKLKQHHTQVQAADDRVKIAKTVSDFQILTVQITQQAELANTMIMYGRLQAVYDKTVAVKAEISSQLEEKETNTLVLAEKRRGLQEIDRTLEGVKAQLDEVKAQLQDQDAGSFGLSGTNTNLDAVYGGLSRSLAYFKELVK